MEPETDENTIKVILLGQSEAGKSSLVYRYVSDDFTATEHTVAAAYSLATFKDQKISIWDTAGEERYSGLARFFCRGAIGAYLVYDITNSPSFAHLKTLLQRVRDEAEEGCKITIIGTKLDLVTSGSEMRDVDLEDAQAWAKSEGATHFETSSKTDMNVKEAFEDLFTRCLDHVSSQKSSNKSTSESGDQPKNINLTEPQNTQTSSKSKCCGG